MPDAFHVRGVFYARAILKSSRFLLASHSEKLAISSLVMSPLMRSHCYLVATLNSQPVVMVASCKANARPRSQDREHSLFKVLVFTFGLGEREL